MRAIMRGKKLGLEEVSKTYKGEVKKSDVLYLLQGYETTAIKVPSEIYEEVAEIPENEEIHIDCEITAFRDKMYATACEVVIL